DRIGKFDIATGQVTETSCGIKPNGAPLGLALGPDGYTVWFAETMLDTSQTGRIGRVTPQAQAILALGSAPNPSLPGQGVVSPATLRTAAPAAIAPTGTITFTEGGTTLGTGSLSGGVATFSTAALAVGGHVITAVYGGDSNFAGSNSPPLTQQVNRTSTT